MKIEKYEHNTSNAQNKQYEQSFRQLFHLEFCSSGEQWNAVCSRTVMFLILRPQTETETANPPPPAELSLANLPLNICDILSQKAGES